MNPLGGQVNRPWRLAFWAVASVCTIVAALAGVAPNAAIAKRAARGRGGLVVHVTGLPARTPVNVRISGPDSFDRRVPTVGTVNIMDARSGRYIIRVAKVSVRRSAGALKAGAVAYSARLMVSVRVYPGKTASASVGYGIVVNPNVHRLTAAPTAVLGNPDLPTGLAVHSGAVSGISAGSFLTSGPTPDLPLGLVAKVTAVHRHGSTATLSLAPAPITAVVPEVSYSGPIDLHPLPTAAAAGGPACGVASGIELTGSMSITGVQLTGLEARLWPARLAFKTIVGVSAKAGWSSTAAASCEYKQTLATWVGEIPVLGVPVYAQPRLALNGTLSVATSNEFEASTHLVSTFNTSPQHVSLSLSGSNGQLTGPTSSAQAEVSAGMYLEVGIGIPDIDKVPIALNIHATLGAALAFTVDPSSRNANERCYIHAKLGSLEIGLTGGPFSLDLASFSGLDKPIHSFNCGGSPSNPGGPKPGGPAGGGGGGGSPPPSESPPTSPETNEAWTVPLTGQAEEVTAPAGLPEVGLRYSQNEFDYDVFDPAGLLMSTTPAPGYIPRPPALAQDGSGYISVTDPSGEHSIVERITPSGSVVWAHTVGTAGIFQIIVGGGGNAYVDSGGSEVQGIASAGGSTAFSYRPSGSYVDGIAPTPAGVAVIEPEHVTYLNADGEITGRITFQGNQFGKYAYNTEGDVFITTSTDCPGGSPEAATSILKVTGIGVAWAKDFTGCEFHLAALPDGGVAYQEYAGLAGQEIGVLDASGHLLWTKPESVNTTWNQLSPLVDSAGHVDTLALDVDLPCTDGYQYCSGQLFTEYNGSTGEIVESRLLQEPQRDDSFITECAGGFALGPSRFYILDEAATLGEDRCLEGKEKLQSFPVSQGGTEYPPPPVARSPE